MSDKFPFTPDRPEVWDNRIQEHTKAILDSGIGQLIATEDIRIQEKRYEGNPNKNIFVVKFDPEECEFMAVKQSNDMMKIAEEVGIEYSRPGKINDPTKLEKLAFWIARDGELTGFGQKLTPEQIEIVRQLVGGMALN